MFTESKGPSVSIGSSWRRRQFMPSGEATARRSLVRTTALYLSSSGTSGFGSLKGTMFAPGPIQTMLLSFEPSTSNRPRLGFSQVTPSALSAYSVSWPLRFRSCPELCSLRYQALKRSPSRMKPAAQGLRSHGRSPWMAGAWRTGSCSTRPAPLVSSIRRSSTNSCLSEPM